MSGYTPLNAHRAYREFNTTVCPITYLLELRVINFNERDSGQYSAVITHRAGTIRLNFTYLLEG